MDICIDFDGTVVKHQYPAMGEDIGAEPVLKELVANKHNLILNTMRHGRYLVDAVRWFNERQIPLYGINAHPLQHEWTTSPKAHGDLFIDDRGLGIPLIQPPRRGDPPYVDWVAVRALLIRHRILPA